MDDAKRAIHIYGQEVATLKGRTIRKRSSPIGNSELLELPPDIRTHHSKAVL